MELEGENYDVMTLFMERRLKISFGIVAAVAMTVATGSSFAQTYECRSTVNPGQVYLSRGIPCPSGKDVNDLTPAQRMEKANEAAAANRQVLIGMTKEQVISAWGGPAQHGTSGEASGVAVEIWKYGCPGTSNAFDRNSDPENYLKIISLVFSNGKLSNIERMCANRP